MRYARARTQGAQRPRAGARNARARASTYVQGRWLMGPLIPILLDEEAEEDEEDEEAEGE